MQNKFFTLGAILLLAASLLACKKSEQAGAKSQPKANADATPASSDKGVLLRVKWPVGSRYVYRMDIDQHSTNKIPQMPKPMLQAVTMAMTYAIAAVKETSGGGRELDMEFLANEMEVKMGDQVVMSFDSKEAAKSNTPNPIAGPYRKIIGTKLRMLVNPSGNLDKIVGLQEWTDKATAGENDQAKGTFMQTFNEGYFHQMVDYGKGFLDKPVQEGDTWPFKLDVPLGAMGKLSIDSKITFSGWEDREQHKSVVLKTTATLKGSPAKEAGPMGKMSIEKGTGIGTSWFDPELGALIEANADQSLLVKGEMGGAGFTSEIGQNVTIKLVEIGKKK